MGKHRKPFRPSDKDLYEVGYGRPPKASRWKAGGPSPYPSGKRKGTKNRATVLNEYMQTKVPIVENGRLRQVTRAEALDIAEYNMAMKGNVRALIDFRKECIAAAKEVKRSELKTLSSELSLQEAADAYGRMIKEEDEPDNSV